MKRWVDLESQTGADINNESEDDINKKEHENNCDKGVNSKEGYEKSGSESDEELLYFAGTQIDKWGPEIDKKIASEMEMGLLRKSNYKILSESRDKYLPPENIQALRVPEMNNEIDINRTSPIGQRETILCTSQSNLTSGIAILANTVNKLAKKKSFNELSREQLFTELSDCVTLLSDVHKEISVVRRMNVKPLLNSNLFPLCKRSAFENKKDNELLFGEDICEKAGQMFKKRKVMRHSSKNEWSRGRGSVSGRRGGRGYSVSKLSMKTRGMGC